MPLIKFVESIKAYMLPTLFTQRLQKQRKEEQFQAITMISGVQIPKSV